MKKVVVTAPGKVIIHGEHAVVYGKKALAGSLGLRTELILEETGTGNVVVDLPDIDVRLTYSCQSLTNIFSVPLCVDGMQCPSGIIDILHITVRIMDTAKESFKQAKIIRGDSLSPTEASSDVLLRLQDYANISTSTNDTKQLAVIAFLYVFCCIATTDGVVSGVNITVHSQLPTSAGLGSSAAFATCLVTSLLIASGHISAADSNGKVDLSERDRELINGWAFMAEKIIHGRPSGIDNSVSTYGGALCFKAGHIEHLTVMPCLRILLVNTCVPRSTKALVEAARQKLDKFADVVNPVLSSIEAISQQCVETLHSLTSSNTGDTAAADRYFHTLEELIDMNKHLLNMLGVGHPSLDTVCSIAHSHGLHGKLTGAGGGGCAFALIPPYMAENEVEKVKEQMSAAGYECFETSLGGAGVAAHVTQSTSSEQLHS